MCLYVCDINRAKYIACLDKIYTWRNTIFSTSIDNDHPHISSLILPLHNIYTLQDHNKVHRINYVILQCSIMQKKLVNHWRCVVGIILSHYIYDHKYLTSLVYTKALTKYFTFGLTAFILFANSKSPSKLCYIPYMHVSNTYLVLVTADLQ